MSILPEDFASRFTQLGEPDLLTVARSYDALPEPAQAALRAEFRKRHLEPPLVEEQVEPGTLEDAANLVTVRRFRDLSEAIVCRSLLESAGIVVQLRDENLVRLDWQVSQFIGGIRLQVAEADAADATALLSQPVPDHIAFGGTSDFDQPLCPICGSTEITFQGASRSAALAGLYLLAIPLPPGRETWHCNVCEATWTETPGSDFPG